METFHSILSFLRSVAGERTLIIFFVACVIGEWIIGRSIKKKTHEFRNTRTNILIGVISYSSSFVFSLLSLHLFDLLFIHYRLFYFPADAVTGIVILFILIDLTEYWFHRLSHEVNIMWMAHLVHHQSRFYNLTVSLRTSFIVPLFNLFFYLLFPVLGFSPDNIYLVVFVQGVYQMLIHTELIGKLGWLDLILVTPSIHRVHHGRNEIYLDKNYGKVFLIWDHLFGTYQCETEKVEYGIKAKEGNEQVIRSVIEPIRELVFAFRSVNGIKAKMKVLFNRPDQVAEIVLRE